MSLGLAISSISFLFSGPQLSSHHWIQSCQLGQKKQDPVEADLKPQGGKSKATTAWASAMLFMSLAEQASLPSFCR